jgi:hypothetical protein
MFVSSFRSICILFDSLLMRLRNDINHLHIVYLLMQQKEKRIHSMDNSRIEKLENGMRI